MRFDGTSSSSAILVDHDRLDNLGVGLAGCKMGEGRIQVEGSTGQSRGWLTISNTHFGGQAGGAGDCSDGIQLGGTDGVVVGPGNEFTGILQAGCGAHADAIQFYGGQNATITGNYFHGNSDGIVNNDKPAVYTVRNNVIVGPFGTGAGIAVTGGNGIQAIHNTVIWGGRNTTIGVDKVNDANTTPATNAVLTGNVTDGGHTDQCGNCTAKWSYNLGTGRSGTGNIHRKPVYVSRPASGYYHYQLRSSSPGYHAASDGKSMGITP
jgi:hypothetical protein